PLRFTRSLVSIARDSAQLRVALGAFRTDVLPVRGYDPAVARHRHRQLALEPGASVGEALAAAVGARAVTAQLDRADRQGVADIAEKEGADGHVISGAGVRWVYGNNYRTSNGRPEGATSAEHPVQEPATGGVALAQHPEAAGVRVTGHGIVADGAGPLLIQPAAFDALGPGGEHQRALPARLPVAHIERQGRRQKPQRPAPMGQGRRHRAGGGVEPGALRAVV